MNCPRCRKELEEKPIIIKTMISQASFDMYVRVTKVEFEKEIERYEEMMNQHK